MPSGAAMGASRLVELPDELLLHVLGYLEVDSLLATSRVGSRNIIHEGSLYILTLYRPPITFAHSPSTRYSTSSD